MDGYLEKRWQYFCKFRKCWWFNLSHRRACDNATDAEEKERQDHFDDWNIQILWMKSTAKRSRFWSLFIKLAVGNTCVGPSWHLQSEFLIETIVGQIYLFWKYWKYISFATHTMVHQNRVISYPLLKQLTAKKNFRARLGDKNRTTWLHLVLPSFVITDFWGTIKKSSQTNWNEKKKYEKI